MDTLRSSAVQCSPVNHMHESPVLVTVAGRGSPGHFEPHRPQPNPEFRCIQSPLAAVGEGSALQIYCDRPSIACLAFVSSHLVAFVPLPFRLSGLGLEWALETELFI